MSDKEARALGAGDTVKVGDKEYKISPVIMQQLLEIQREALSIYKRQYLQTYAQNVDLLGSNAVLMMEKKLEEAARWDIGDLPIKIAHDVSGIELTDELLELLTREYGELPDGVIARQGILSTALDSGKISAEQVKAVAGTPPTKVRVPYDTWWITATFEGMVAFVTASVRASYPEMTKNDIGRWPLGKIIEIARMVERLTAPSLGNT